MSSEVYSRRTKEWYAPYLDRFKPLASPLLELGAGHGLLLDLVRSRGMRVVGVEYEADRVEPCCAQGLDVIQHDLANRLPFADAGFANIYCGQVIEHLAPAAQRIRPTSCSISGAAFARRSCRRRPARCA